MDIKLPLLFIIGMVTQSESFLVGPSKTIQENEVLLSYGNPCEFMMDDALKEEIARIEILFQDEQKAGRAMHCRSEKLFQFEACILKSRKLSDTISKFPMLVKGRIFKREIMHDIYSGIIQLPKIIIAAATTWIKSMSKDTIVELVLDVSKDLLQTLLVSGHSEYNNLTLIPYNTTKEEITRVSIYAQKHPEILDDAIRNANDVHQFLDYLSDEFLAAEVLLAGIYKLLKRSQIDTHFLANWLEVVF